MSFLVIAENQDVTLIAANEFQVSEESNLQYLNLTPESHWHTYELKQVKRRGTGFFPDVLENDQNLGEGSLMVDDTRFLHDGLIFRSRSDYAGSRKTGEAAI